MVDCRRVLSLSRENFREAQSRRKCIIDVATFSISPEDYNDPYFGLMKIFKKPVQAIFKASHPPLKAEDVVEIAYQGCTSGFCYPPEVKEIKVADLPIAQVTNTEKNIRKIDRTFRTT